MGIFAEATKQDKGVSPAIKSLLDISQAAGPEVEQEAKSIVERLKGGAKSTLRTTLDIVSRPNFAVASAVKNIVDEDPVTTFLAGLKTGVKGETKITFGDVLQEAGWKPETLGGRIAKGVTGFALDVLLDPTTYITLGVGAGAKITGKGVQTIGKTITLTKKGKKFLKKAVELGGERGLSKELAGDAIIKLTQKNPALAKEFIDKGGVKYFGKTLLSSNFIRSGLKAIPGTKTIDRLTAPIRNTTFALFDRKFDPKFGRLPDEFIKFEQKFRDLAKTKPREVIKFWNNIARANKLTAPEAEIISNAIEMGTKIADIRLENVRQIAKTQFGKLLKEERGLGIRIGELTNYVPHIGVKENVGDVPFKISAGLKKRVGKPGFIKARKIEGTIEEINQAFGKDFFKKDIIEVGTIRTLASQKAQIAKQYLREVGENFGKLANEAHPNYVESTAKELKGLKFHPVVGRRIDEFTNALGRDEASQEILKQFDRLQNVWKASVTSIFPAFHGRNAISNIFLNFMDMGRNVLSPANNSLATSMLIKNARVNTLERVALGIGEKARVAQKELSVILNTPAMTDIFGVEYTFGALRALAKRNNIAFTGEFFAADIPTAIGRPMFQVSKVKKTLPIFSDFYGYEKGKQLGSAIEGHARLVNFLHNLKNSGDPLTAAARTKRFLFDYGNLTQFEKNFMRRIMPFYTFTRKNLEVQVVEGLKAPGRIATQAKIFNTIGDIISSGDQASEEEIRTLPEWMQEGLLIMIGRDDPDISFITSLGLPIEQSLGLDSKEMINMLSPLIKFPVEKVTGRSLFFEKEIKDITDARPFINAPQFIKDYIGYKAKPDRNDPTRTWHVSTRPERMHLLMNLPPTSRIWSFIKQVQDVDVPANARVFQQLTGIKPRTRDIEREKISREKEIIRELEDLLETRQVGATFEKFFIPKEKKKELGL